MECELCLGVLHGLFAVIGDVVPNTLVCLLLAIANLLKLTCLEYVVYFRQMKDCGH